jgi:putative peptidoglycan lipid II flippase
MAVQFARERFAVPALAPLLYNGGIIAGGLLLIQRPGMEGFAWGVLAGAFVGNFLLQYRGAKRVGLRLRFSLDLRHPALRTYIRLTLPLMVGLTMMFSTEFFFKFFGSYLPHGGISALNYGLRLMLALVAFFGQAVGVASFPFLARMAAENRLKDLSRLLDDTLRYLSLVIPFSVLLIVLRNEMVSILFQRGRFDADAVELTARVLPFLLVGSFAFAAQTLVARGYYAVRDTFFPALYGTLAVLASLPVYLAGLRYLGIEGVALAVSLSAVLQVTVLYALWNRRVGNADAVRVYKAFGRQALISIPMGLLFYLGKNLLFGPFEPLGLVGSLLVVVVVGVLFSAAILGIGYGLGFREIVESLERFRSRWRHENTGTGPG